MTDVYQRFYEKIEYAGHCWIWVGGTSGRRGGPCFIVDGVNVSAARWIYQEKRGLVADGKVLRHVEECRNKLCVNPDHLVVAGEHDTDSSKVPTVVAIQPMLQDLRNQTWMDEGLCKWVENKEIFWPPAPGGKPDITGAQLAAARKERKAEALKYCTPCPVRWQCLKYALKHPGIDGIWGGTARWDRESPEGRANLGLADEPA